MSDWRAIPKSYKFAWLILLCGLLASGYAGHAVKSDIDQEVQSRFASNCDAIQLKIEARLQSHTQVLLGGAALFEASDSVSRQAWHAYAKRVEIDQHFNGIQGLGFSLWIPENQLVQHITEIRRQGFPQYTVTPAGARDEYSAIVYLEPFNGRNLRAFGYDMYSEPVRRVAMEQARDENIISLSGKVKLVQENGEDVQSGTLMYVPVYKKAMPIETVEQRRAALYGWVYSPFRMADLFHGVLKGWDIPQSRYLRMQIYDGLGVQADSLLYSSEEGQKSTFSPSVLFSIERHMDFNGREWTLHFDLLKDSVSGIDYSKVWMVLLGGAGLSILSFFLILSYLNTRRNAARIAEELTAESLKASGYARRLIEASLDPLLTISPEGKITDVNKATEGVTGRSRTELIGTDFSDYFTEPDKAREGYQRVFARNFVTDYPLVLRHSDGHLTDVLYNASVYRNEAGEVLGVFAAARDVTERKNAEFVLRQSEEALKEAQRLAHVGSWHMDLATNEVVWSEVLYQMYGFDPALPPPLYTESMQLFTPESWEKLSTSIARAVESGIPYELELEMVPKDGGRKWMLARGELVRDARGAPVRVRGVVMDITERKLAEQQLSRRLRHREVIERINQLSLNSTSIEDMLGSVLDEILAVFNADRAFFLYPCDPDAPSWSVPMERTRPEWPGALARGMVIPTNPEVAAIFRELFASTEPLSFGPAAAHRSPASVDEQFSVKSQMQMALRPRVGSPWVMGLHHCAQARTYEEDELLMFKDIGQRVEDALSSMIMLKNLRELNNDFVTLLDNTDDFIYFKDQESRIRFCSQTLANITGHASWRDMIGKQDKEIFPADTARIYYEEELPIFREGKPLLNKTDPYYDAEGKPGWVNTSKLPVFGDDGKTVVGIFGISRDITELKEAEDKINELNRDLEQRVIERTGQLESANKELESFSYSVSHDLRTPLRAIDGFSHILLDDYGDKLDDEGKRLLGVVRDNTQKMGQLIEDILKFSRTGRVEISLAEIDMEKLAHEVFAELPAASGNSKLQLEIAHIPPVMGDRAMMRQVFVNLLSNAIKFSAHKDAAKIEVGGSVAQNEVIYFVKDNGAGFDMQYADKLFGVFQRLHGVDEFEGTGIGLAIVKRIVNRHGGRVWAEGKLNEGATIYFALPVKAVLPVL